MTGQQSNQRTEIVVMGVQYPMPHTIPPEKIWAAMIQKIYQTEKFLPLTDVKITYIIPGRRIYREMVVRGCT